MEDDFFPRYTHQQDLYDEDVDPQVMNIEDDDDPSESLDIDSTAQIYSSATGKLLFHDVSITPIVGWRLRNIAYINSLQL